MAEKAESQGTENDRGIQKHAAGIQNAGSERQRKADEVPLSGSTEDFGVRIIPYLMNSFVYDDDRNYLTMNGGKVESAAITPEWKEGLTYIKSLYDED